MPACPKSKPLRDKFYRESARHRQCDIPTCYAVGEASGVVLAHINVAGNFGYGMKAPDSHSLFLCAEHHQEFDSGDRCRWLVVNYVLPLREGAYQRWKVGTGR